MLFPGGVFHDHERGVLAAEAVNLDTGNGADVPGIRELGKVERFDGTRNVTADSDADCVKRRSDVSRFSFSWSEAICPPWGA